jgi:hypothetical protein
MPRKEQVAVSRFRTGYTRATQGPKIEGVSNPLCPFCNTHLSVDHIQWECKETDSQQPFSPTSSNGYCKIMAKVTLRYLG